MKKIMAMMLSIAVVAMSGNVAKADPNVNHQYHNVSGNVISSDSKLSTENYTLELSRAHDKKQQCVAINEVGADGSFNLTVKEDGTYRLKIMDAEGNVVLRRVFHVQKDDTSCQLGNFDVATSAAQNL